MKKKRNVLKRNSGFIVLCVVAAGASALASNAFMVHGGADYLVKLSAESETEQLMETAESEKLMPETEDENSYEMKGFTVLADGSIYVDGNQTQEDGASDAGESSDAEGSGDSQAEGTDYSNVEITSEITVDFWSDSIMPQTAVEYISGEDLANFNYDEIRLIRYEMYARHGRKFSDPDMDYYFESRSWYTPLYDEDFFDENIYDFLNEYELANQDLLLQYEAGSAE